MIEFLPLVLTGLGIIVSILYYTNTLRNQNRSRRTQLFMNLYDTYRSLEFRKVWHTMLHLQFEDYEEWDQKYSQDVEILAAHTSVMSFFEGVGVLLKQRLIDIEIVDDLLSVAIRSYWRKYQPVVNGTRKLLNEPKVMADSEYLYMQIMKRYSEAPDVSKLINR